MKVTIFFETNMNEDGVDQGVMIERDGIELITDLLDLYGDAARAAGFSYVDRMGYSTEKGSETWSKF